VKHLIVRWMPTLGMMALIFVLSAQPGLRISNDPGVDLPIRHVAHVFVFALLAAFLVRALAWNRPGRPLMRDVALAIVLATLYGVSDEIHQTYVPDRTGHLVDVGWDLLGACLGAVAARLLPVALLRWPDTAQRRRENSAPGPQAS
jgi:VanZ family protein